MQSHMKSKKRENCRLGCLWYVSPPLPHRCPNGLHPARTKATANHFLACGTVFCMFSHSPTALQARAQNAH